MPLAPVKPAALGPQRFAGLSHLTPTKERKIYFAEATNGSNGPTEFFHRRGRTDAEALFHVQPTGHYHDDRRGGGLDN